MKRKLFILAILAMLIAALAITANAENIDSGTCGDNLTWTLDSNGTLTISGTGEIGNYNNLDFRPSPWYKIRSEVKSLVIEDGITYIGAGPFQAFTNLTNLYIGNGVTSIEERAFADCTSLSDVYIPDNVTKIGNYAFNGCKNLNSLTIGDGVESIGMYAFCDAHLTSLTIGGSVSEIGRHAFHNCSIKDVYITDPSAWCRISFEDTFANPMWFASRIHIIDEDGTEQRSVVFDDEVTKIGSYAFRGAELDSITFTGKAPSVAAHAFLSVTATAYYPAGDDTWTEDVMQDYGGTITWVAYEPKNEVASGTCGENLTWTLDDTHTLTISGTGDMEDYGEIGNHCPWLAYTVKSVVIEHGATSIGDYAFEDCVDIEQVSISDSVTTIGKAAFAYCEALKQINIPAGVTKIGERAFNNCQSITELLIPESVVSIGNDAFSGCTQLTKINIPNQLTQIGSFTFGACSSLKSIVIPESVTSIGDCAFGYCTGLESVNIPNGVTRIADYLFVECSSLVEITIPEGVTYIGEEAFDQCTGLTRITIPSNVSEIGTLAFYGCTSLTEIYFEGDAPSFGDYFLAHVEATAYYPANNETWTDEVMQDYSGTITWVAVGGCEHNYEPVITAPICTEKGYTTFTCKDCGDSYVGDRVNALGHNLDENNICTRCGVPMPTSSGWIVPCRYVALTSPFGYRLHPISGAYKIHYGVDLTGPQGTPIYATRSGIVTAATYNGSAGYYVTINHGDGFSSIYMHMTHYIVYAGQYVNQGQVIGYMGSTGGATGTHLHFGISYNGTYVNPAIYVNFGMEEEKPNYNGLVCVDGVWGYYIDGVLQTDYTGLVPYEDKMFYVENGILDFKYTGLVWYNDAWTYVANSELTEGYTGLVWFNNNWFYVVDSVIDWTFTGLVRYDDDYFYVQNNLLDWSYTGLGYHDGGWYFIQNGLLQKDYSGLVYFNDNWFYVEEGELTYQYFGMVEYEDNMFYVQASHLDWSYTGLGYHEGAWYYFQNALYTTSFTGLVPFNGSLFYVKDGTIDWTYNGTAEYNDTEYTVLNGVVDL